MEMYKCSFYNGKPEIIKVDVRIEEHLGSKTFIYQTDKGVVYDTERLGCNSFHNSFDDAKKFLHEYLSAKIKYSESRKKNAMKQLLLLNELERN